RHRQGPAPHARARARSHPTRRAAHRRGTTGTARAARSARTVTCGRLVAMNRLRLVCLASLLGALATPSPSRADEGGSPQAAAPAWLRAPATRGPIAGGLAYD